MKFIKSLNLSVLAVIVAIVFAGCKTAAPKPTPLPGSNGSNVGNNGLDSGAKFGTDQPIAQSDQTGVHPPNDPNAHANWAQDPEALKAQIVYFDLDKSTFKSSEQGKLDAVVSYLKSNPDKAVRVEGNCDERGTEEYNRSLGEHRASAAREFFISSGIDASRVDTLTNGEDKPAATGHSEDAYAKNRRDEFIVLSPH